MPLRFAQLAAVLGTVGKLRWKLFSGLVMQMVVMIAFFLSLVFSLTGLIFTYENVYFTGGLLPNYFVALYLCGITLTTVGYGDYSALSRAGRIVIILGVTSAFWMVPPLLAAVIEPWRKYHAERTYTRSGHAVIFSRSEDVQTVVDQFYRSRATVAEDLLIMTNVAESSDLKTFLRSEFLRLRVTHYHGDWSNPKVVARTAPIESHYILLVQEKFTDDPETADANMIAGALAVLRVSKAVPLFIQLNSASRSYAFDHNLDNIICMEDLRRGLLVLNCTAPGVLAVISNLIISKPSKTKRHKGNWLAPYKNGLHAHLETDVPLTAVVGHTWLNVCIALRALFNITFLSIWNPILGLQLFPLQHEIATDDVGQFIHDDGRKSIMENLEADQFQKYLIMLKASAHIDDVDHMKALSLADMIESEDAKLVKQFNLYQRSNLSDLLSRSVTSGEEDVDEVQDVKTEGSHHPNNGNTRTSKPPSSRRASVSSKHGARRSEDGDDDAEHHSASSSPSPSPKQPRSTAKDGDAKEGEGDRESSHQAIKHKYENDQVDEEVDNHDNLEQPQHHHHRHHHRHHKKAQQEQPQSRASAATPSNVLQDDRSSLESRKSSVESQRRAVRNKVGSGDAEMSSGEDEVLKSRTSGTASRKSRPSVNNVDPYIPTVFAPSMMIAEDEMKMEKGQYWDQNVAKRTSLEGHLSKHIIVCGKANVMTTSIARRLQRRAPPQQSIVLMISGVPEASQKVLDHLAALDSVDRIYVLIGHPVSPNDLRRAAAMTARVCLILPDKSGLSDPTMQAAQDSHMLITYHLLSQTNVFPIIELMNPNNEQLMMMNDSSENEVLASACGSVFKRSLFDNILTQAVFKPHLIPLVESMCDANIAHLALSKVWEDIAEHPESPHERILFGQVFSYLLENRSCLAIAIYRKKRDAQDEWLAKQEAKGRLHQFPLRAAKAFRQRKQEKHQVRHQQQGEDESRIAINSPRSDSIMLGSDVIIVIQYHTNPLDVTRRQSIYGRESGRFDESVLESTTTKVM